MRPSAASAPRPELEMLLYGHPLRRVMRRERTLVLLVTAMATFGFAFGAAGVAAAEVGAVVHNAGAIDFQTMAIGSPENQFPATHLPTHLADTFESSTLCVQGVAYNLGGGYYLHCATPQDLRSAYNFGPAYAAVGGAKNAGAGQTIVIFDAFGDPTIHHDLAVFDAANGLPPAKLNVICPMGCPVLDMSGTNPLSDDEIGWTIEESIDVQEAHALAPGATIDLVVSWNDSDQNFAIAEEYALDFHLGNIWSQSFGSPECTFVPGPLNPWFAFNNKIYAEAAAQGVTIYAAAGDGWAQEGCPLPSASYPADNPNNIAVAGTHLNLTFGPSSPRAHYGYETTWNSCEDPTLLGFMGGAYQCGEGGTGGAASAYFPAPWWQSGLTVTPYDCSGLSTASCTTGAPTGFQGKWAADVAIDGDPDGGVWVFDTAAPAAGVDGFYLYGGTSIGTPMWAAISAILDQLNFGPLGNIAPVYYFLGGTGAFNDITVGSNTYYPGVGYLSTPGWDGASGMGSPNVGELINWI